jgi:hypothetical protein
MPGPYVIEPPKKRVLLDAQGQGTAEFQVKNSSPAQKAIVVKPVASDPSQQDWLTLDGDAERQLKAGGAETFRVKFKAPKGTAPGDYTFSLLVASLHNEEEYETGPLVVYEVPVPKPKRKIPVWAIAAALGAVVLVAGLAYWLTRGGTTPSVMGEKVDRAEQLLQEEGLKVGPRQNQLTDPAKAGTIVRQRPTAGEPVPKNGLVELWIGVASVAVPDVRRKDIVEAVLDLQKQNLRLGKVSVERTTVLATGQILNQFPLPPTTVEMDSAVDVVVVEQPGQTLPTAVTAHPNFSVLSTPMRMQILRSTPAPTK